jgi:CTP synthase
LQCVIIDFARHVCEIKGANSTEFDSKSPNPVINLMESQKAIKIKGGTMRLGSYDCDILPNTKAAKIYKKKTISERHRHRWEVNNKFVKKMESNGLVFSGMNKDLGVVEIVELADHPWFVGCQFHPELKSRVDKAHPLFREFVKASLKEKQNGTK